MKKKKRKVNKIDNNIFALGDAIDIDKMRGSNYSNGLIIAGNDPLKTPHIDVDAGNTTTPKGKGGGGMSAAGIAGMAQDAVSLFNSAMNNAKIKDTTEDEKKMASTGLQSVANDSLDTLSNDWSSNQWLQGYTAKDLRQGNTLGSVLNSTVQGASAGAAAGSWGAVIGGVVGLGSSLVGSLIGNNKAKKKAASLTKQANNANAVAVNSFANRADNINDNTMSNLEINMYNSAALGGNLFAPGGMLNTDGSQFNTGTTYINNGGTHEENPYDGVPMGYDNQGIPNKVEEGEVIWDDYVFSNRINVPKDIKKKLKLKDGTFADAAKQLGKLIEEQPNDSIAKRTYDSNMNNLREAQETVKAKRERAKQLRAFNNMSADEKLNMMQAAQQQAMQEQQMQEQAMQEQYAQEQQPVDEINMQAYGGNLFAPGGRLKTYDTLLKPLKDLLFEGTDEGFQKRLALSSETLFGDKNMKNANGLHLGIDRDIYGNYEKDSINMPLIIPQHLTDPNKNKALSPYMYGDKNFRISDAEYLKNKPSKHKLKTQDLRYVPAIGGAISAMQSILSKPDESAANNIINASRERNYTPVQFNPIGEYMKPKYFDLDYAINEANAQAGATRRNILNTAGNRGAVMAGLLAADYNALNNIGKLRRQADEYNDAREEKMLTFNRGTSQYNSEGQLKVDMANQQSLLNSGNTYLNAVMNAEKIRQAARAQRAQEVNANLTNVFNSIGNIGREAYNFNMLNGMPGFTWMIDRNGNSIYKAGNSNTKK